MKIILKGIWKMKHYHMRRLMDQENKQILPHQKVIEIINLGNNKEKKEVKIGTALSANIKKKIINLFHEFTDVFA